MTLAQPRRLWVTDETGLGKSVTAIAAAQAMGAQRVLIITKGMVRPAWLERLQEWWPGKPVGSITMGRDRKNLSKPAQARLLEAYAAPIQVVSYDLLKHVDLTGWDLIVLDEMHELVCYRSDTSQRLRNIFNYCPQAAKIGLTATLLSAEPKNVWNLLQMFWPEQWGKPLESGDPPWSFQRKYCERYENEYGVLYRGLNPKHAALFSQKIRAVSVRTLRSEVADLLPPIDCAPLLVEAGNTKGDQTIALDWCDTASRESTHISIFAYYRESAAELVQMLQSLPRYSDVAVRLITGAHTPEQRHKELQALRDSPRAILVGTMDSLGTGITLTAFQQYLLTEIPTTANKLVQVIGRFSRLDSMAPCRGMVLLREGRDDDTIATLRRRLGDINTLIRAGRGEQALLSVLESPLQGDAFDRRLDALIDSFNGESIDDDDAA